MSDAPDNVVHAAFNKAKPRAKKAEADKPKEPRKTGGGEPPPRDPPPGVLPWDSPVTALGVDGRMFYFLNVRGQFMPLQDKDIGRLAIIGMFGGDNYLRQYWPKYDKSGKFVVNFDHGAIGTVLITSCDNKGIWTPEDNVRGVGTWTEDDGTLVMHCGDFLFLSGSDVKIATGLRGRMLYPAASPQPHPEKAAAGAGGPGEVLLKKLKSWNWARGELDAKLHLGWIGAGILGAAPDWRPIEWVTGGSGTGKSTLMKLTRWVFGHRAMITSEDATPAGIKHRTKNTALPVSIDELESDGKGNDRAREITKLARIASSGGESLRGSPSGDAMGFTARNAFQFSSIVIPSLPQQDKNRMAILSLEPVEWEGARRTREPGEDFEDDEVDHADEEDSILGSKAEWARIGRQLRGRVLAEWGRYRKTFRAYRRALERQGHNARGCDQFGALGAAYDLVMFDGEEDLAARAASWADVLPAASLAETSGYSASHEACLAHLLGATLESWRGGSKESVARLLRSARYEREERMGNDHASVQVLEQVGIKVYRDKRDPDGQSWWVAVSDSHPGLARIFHGTDWGGLPGAPGAWAQMIARLPGAMCKIDSGKPMRLRFDGHPEYCKALPWDTVLPPGVKGDSEDELVRDTDRG